MRVARADGVLLKPDRPALAIDSQWYGDIFHAGLLQSETGEISETVSLKQSIYRSAEALKRSDHRSTSVLSHAD